MKKILSLVLVVVMLMSMTVTAFAAEGEQSGTSTVTAVVPEPVPEYTIHIPADVTLEYGNGERQLVGEVSVTDAQNVPYKKFIIVDMEATPLKSTEGNVIPAVFEFGSNSTGEYLNIDMYRPSLYSSRGEDSSYSTVKLYATVTEADWKAAKPGTYTSTITYNFRISG